jgi:hypothetical protein
MFAFVVIKAASADMTWDEAWTYLFYGRTPLGFTRLDYANDHMLNSFLIWLATRLFGNSELVIRLPNILAAALYLYTTAKLVGVVRLKLLAFSICALQPYLMDYFALARGYGLAAALVQFGVVQGLFLSDGRRVGVMLTCCLLASLAVSSTAIVLYALIASLLIMAGWHYTRNDEAMTGLGLPVLFGVLGLAPVAALLWVSREGLPLTGSMGGFFDAVPRGVARMYVPDSWSYFVAVVGLLAIFGLMLWGMRRFGSRAIMLLIASVLVLVVTWLSARVLGKPLPSGRVLIPFIPLWNLTLIAMAEDVFDGAARAVSDQVGSNRHPLPAVMVRLDRTIYRGTVMDQMVRSSRTMTGTGRFNPIGNRSDIWFTAFSSVLCAALIVIYAQKLHFQRYQDWPEDYRLSQRLARALASGKCIPPDVWGRYGHVYYLDRWFGPGQGPPDVPCPPQ